MAAPRPDRGAYDAAASFVLFARERLGQAGLREALRRVGATQRLPPELAALEPDRLAGLSAGRTQRPRVVAQTPRPGATGVPATTRELVVELDVDMAPVVCVGTITLGVRACRLRSQRGFELPVTAWRFRTE